MNWFHNFYFGEGPGIPKDAPKPTALRLLAHVLGREWWDLIKLNLLFIAFSLPIVTLPAAYSAVVNICVMMIEDRNVYLWRDFWSAFRSRFRFATLSGALLAAGGALSGLAVQSYAAAVQQNLIFAVPLAIAMSVSVLLPLFGACLFTALALGDRRTARDVLCVAAIGLFARPLPGVAALAFVGLLWLVHILFYPASVLMPVLVNFSLGALVTSFAALEGVRFGFSRMADNAHAHVTRRPKTQSA